MGLDMYLNKMSDVKNWQHQPKETHHHVLVTQDGKPCTHILPERIMYVVEEVAYWRKANAIHRWCVENVQHDNDDCRTYPVTRDQLSQLRDDCRTVLAASTLTDGKITNGERYENARWCKSSKTARLLRTPAWQRNFADAERVLLRRHRLRQVLLRRSCLHARRARQAACRARRRI
jgi:hypothetical protein